MSKNNEPRTNRAITAPSIRLVDENGNMIGVVKLEEALSKAEYAGLDLVEISPNAEPPVCKILDYGKHRYEAQKKAHEARKKQKVVQIKEIKLRPTIDKHDLDIKLNRALKFLEGGDKVRISMRFRGREMDHVDIGLKVLDHVQETLGEVSKVEQMPKREGRQFIMTVAPK
ncbi:MAG: translation initiation factor IF-3 [Rickettsiales bacterium]